MYALERVNRHIKRKAKQDKKDYLRGTVEEIIDQREKWAGLKQMKKNYAPKLYNQKDIRSRKGNWQRPQPNTSKNTMERPEQSTYEDRMRRIGMRTPCPRWH
jgi:hypothetical protein